MTQQVSHPPRLDWRSLDEKERLIWAAAFVAGDRAGEVGVEAADAMVGKLRTNETTADPAPASVDDPSGEPPLQRVFDAFFRGIESRRGGNARNDRALQPVYEALAHGVSITPEEFEHWYRVAYRIAMRGTSAPDRPTEDVIARAMEAYGKGCLDFF
jgi:hypothetical protein